MSIQPTPWQSSFLRLPVLIQVRIEITGHIVQLSSTTATLRNQIALHCRPESHIIRVGPIWQTVQNVPADHIRSDRKKCRCLGVLGSMLTMIIWAKPFP